MNIDRLNLKLIFFDLDQTLAESKSAIQPDMSSLLLQLLEKFNVCIISSGNYEQFKTYVIPNISAPSELLKKLHLMPVQGAEYYAYKELQWQKQYEIVFSKSEKNKIIVALKQLIETEDVLQTDTFGEQIEDRGGQVTMSALGQNAPSSIKHSWDPTKAIRLKLREKLLKELPEFKITLGGSTSIDITKPGMDKSIGVNNLVQTLKLNISNCIYIGDNLEPGGNDFEVIKTGIYTIPTTGPENTKEIIQNILSF